MVHDRHMKVVDSYHFSVHEVTLYSSFPADIFPPCSRHRIYHRQDHSYASSQKFRKLHGVASLSMLLLSINDSYYRCYLLCWIISCNCPVASFISILEVLFSGFRRILMAVFGCLLHCRHYEQEQAFCLGFFRCRANRI